MRETLLESALGLQRERANLKTRGSANSRLHVLSCFELDSPFLFKESKLKDLAKGPLRRVRWVCVFGFLVGSACSGARGLPLCPFGDAFIKEEGHDALGMEGDVSTTWGVGSVRYWGRAWLDGCCAAGAQNRD